MLCVHHCHSIAVPSPLAPPLIFASMDPQTLCPEGEEEGEGRKGSREKRRRVKMGDGKLGIGEQVIFNGV